MEVTKNTCLLSKCPVDRIEEFGHGLIDGILGRARLRYKDYGKIWDIEEWFDVLDACQRCVKKMSQKELTKEQVSQLFDGVPADHVQGFVGCVNIRAVELRQHLLEEVTAISHSHLQNFDWKLKLALSSDKISSVQEPLVSVDFDISSGDETETVSLEMNQDEFKKFVNSLEAASKVVLQMQT
ncbi:COMM domain-containing protein 8-like [Anneissia japonica]|uniref:COMM domain-containing protein 8-like n=1 Tax=Anneissia japonica TaxID=1529436 RepID=UPI0014259783|nr:COMM domain-containing protein 8-like [Anneissia japonica]